MYMDNRVFNVNGHGKQGLLDTLNLVFKQEGENTKCTGWKESKEHGLILLWSNDNNANALITPLTANEVTPMVLAWIGGDFAQSMELTGWDADSDHDGSNTLGWRVYCGDWGRVGDESYTICAVTPAYAWHGK